MREVFVVGAKRLAQGKDGGALAEYEATELATFAINGLLESLSLPLSVVDFVCLGNVCRHGLGQHPARKAAFDAGLPFAGFNALNLNQVCGSGLTAVNEGFLRVATGQSDVALCGGMESMSRIPHMLLEGRKLNRFQNLTGEQLTAEHVLQNAMFYDGLLDWNGKLMGVCAEIVADDFGITREAMDAWALRSNRLAHEAHVQGYFNAELISLMLDKHPKSPFAFRYDEGIRPETTLESLAGLRPAFQKDGRVTAGNSSQISDGAAVVLLMTAEKMDELGLRPLARIVAFASAAAPKPDYVLVAPLQGIPKVLAAAGMAVPDIELWEINEAFAAPVVAEMRELEIHEDIVNVSGGAVALGHPVGASGCRLLVTLLHNMLRLDKEIGLISLCLGGAESANMIIERA